MTLLELLQERNAKTRAWVAEDPENRWAGTLTEDLSHWEEYGVTTVEEFERYELETTIWEAYKDAYGVRPRHMDFKSMTIEELRQEADFLCNAAQEAADAEQKQAEEDVLAFKRLVDYAINLGADNEETALRWLTSNEQFYSKQDVEHFVWGHGILFTDYGKELVEKLCSIVTFMEYEEAA